MMPALFAFLSLLGLRLTVSWYLWFAGRLPPKGVIFGFQYDSPLIRALVTNIHFLWYLLLLNIGFTLIFFFGLRGLRSFALLMMLDIAASACATVLFGTLVAKDKFDAPMIIGIVVVTCGALLLAGHEQINRWLSSL